jgi:gluconate 2-dehydrogenase gamma chain
MADSAIPHAYGYLTHAEVRFLDAAADRLIPPDDLGPGGRDARVSVYIDRQLSGVWGVHGRSYRSGPWAEGTPQQGYQSRLTPREIYRACIRETNDYCGEQFGKSFENLSGEQQDEVLTALEHGKVELPSVSSKLFFDILWRNTEEGFFADPMYGGNHDKVGWKLLGFPGVASGAYRGHLENPDIYRAEPVSILDIEQGKARLDAQGFPKHTMIKKV